MSADRLNQIQKGILPPFQSTVPAKKPEQAGGFAEALQQQLALKLSAHAQTRMQSRNINIDPAQWQRVESGIEKAAAKGAKESLVLLDDLALVVSVRNRTVITAVDKESLKENVFTNIDSAVIV